MTLLCYLQVRPAAQDDVEAVATLLAGLSGRYDVFGSFLNVIETDGAALVAEVAGQVSTRTAYQWHQGAWSPLMLLQCPPHATRPHPRRCWASGPFCNMPACCTVSYSAL